MADKEPERALARQAPHHSPDEPKARALALSAEGHSSEAIGGIVGVSGRTVQRWVKRGREVSLNQEVPEILNDWARIVRRSQGMQHAVLDALEDMVTICQDETADDADRAAAAKELLKHGLLANVYSGTGSDKLQKEREPAAAGNVQIIFNFKDRPPDPEHPDTIEGELVS